MNYDIQECPRCKSSDIHFNINNLRDGECQKCHHYGEHTIFFKEVNNVHTWLKEINEKYPSFNPSNWIPPTSRDRKDKDGYQYKNIRYNPATKTFIYEIKPPNERASGPYHGRTLNMLLKLEEA